MLLIALALQVAAVPGDEADRLGTEVARHGTLASLLPLIAAKETGELIAQHPELDAAAQADLRRTAAETYARGLDRLFAVTGHEYAKRLTPAELRELIAFYRTPVAARLQAVQPQVIAGTMASVGTMDFKGDTLKAFCAKTGKLCPVK